MATPIDENPASVYSDEIVHTQGEFPELTKAVRDGDLATVSILCAQLFDLDASSREEENRLKARTTPKPNDVSPA